MRAPGGRKRVGFSSMSDSDEGEMPGRKGSASSLQKVFHEELVLQWIVAHPQLRVLVLGNAWFFFELLVSVCVCVCVCVCVWVCVSIAA